MVKSVDYSRLKTLRNRVKPFDFNQKPKGSLFVDLASSIVSQQLSLKAAATIFGRFTDLFPDKIPTPEAVLNKPQSTLRGVGFSEAKCKALYDLAQKTIDGIVPTDGEAKKLSDDELVNRLIQVRGIGRWTVEMILIFRYRRPDVWPVHDLGVQKGFRLIFPKLRFSDAKGLMKHGKLWAGSRTEMAWLSWRALEEEIKETWQGIPLTHSGLKLMLWLKGGVPARLDFTRDQDPPIAEWPGLVKVTKNRHAIWQKKLYSALKHGIAVEELLLSGTPFQKSVWKEIQAIPFGETRSYLDIAKAVGNPKGVRAIAQACGANPLPLFIPCHRVVGTGNLGGFGGGVDAKKRLLSAEGQSFL